MRKLIGLVLALALGCPAAGQESPPADDSTLVEELVVRPRTPGPAWWRVSDADTTIHILVAPPYAPAGLDWDRSVMERRLRGANRLILPAGVNLNPLSFMRAMTMLPAARDGKAVESKVSPRLREKFVALRRELGKPADAYDGWVLHFVASNLQHDYLEHKGLVRDGVQAEMEAAARRLRVPREKAGAIPVAATRVRFDALPGETCLEAAIDGLAARSDALRQVAAAWAEGDVRPILSPPRASLAPGDCSPDAATNVPALRPQLIAEEVATFERALRTPGRAVALIEPRYLLTRGGVLDQLRAKGYAVAAPDLIQD